MLQNFLIGKAITAFSLLLLIDEITTVAYQKQHVNVIPAAKLSVNAKQAKTISYMMDSKMNPCDDFFSYACKNWIIYHNQTRRYVEVGGFIDHKVNKKLAIFLENYKPGTVERRNEEQAVFDDIFQKVRSYYRACKREKNFQMIEYLKLVQQLDDINLTTLQYFDWWLSLAKLRRYGFKGVILKHNVVPKYENNSAYTIELDPADPSMKLPKRRQVIDYFEILGLNRTQAAVKYKAIKQLERQLQNLLEIEDEYDLLELTIEDLEEDLSDVNWYQYFDSLLKWNTHAPIPITLRHWEYFVRAIALLKESENEVICNYILIMFMQYLLEDGTSSFEKIDCVVDVRSKMDFAVNYIYREHFYSSTNERDTLIILEAIKYEFAQLFKENHLHLEERAIEILKEKLANVRINFGNLPANKQERTAFIKEYYSYLQLDPNNYYKNHLALLALRCAKEHWQLMQPAVGKNYVLITDSSTAYSSMPYFVLQQNIIIMPYGIFQPPIFHKNMHTVLKLSIFGFLLAHELVHAFDESGLYFDHVGNLYELGKNFTENKYFNESLECLQRSEHTATIDERIADIVAVRLAYNTYFASSTAIDPTLKVHFSDYTMRRLFFLNLAQYFCGSMQAKFLDHDNDNMRLKQIFKNFSPFAEEFKCQLGDVMFPREQCRVW